MDFDQKVDGRKHDFRMKKANIQPWILNNKGSLASFKQNKKLVLANKIERAMEAKNKLETRCRGV